MGREFQALASEASSIEGTPAGWAGSLLSLDDIAVSYGQRRVLTSVTLDVAAHGVLALLGPAGTGKSTLLRVISGMQTQGGSVRIDGKMRYRGLPLGPENQPVLLGQKLPQLLTTVTDYLVDGMPNRNQLTRLEQIQTLHAMLQMRGLDYLIDSLDERLVDLTFADRRYLAVARVLQCRSPLICLDEPTADMDDDQAAPVRRMIGSERYRRAIIMVTHHQGEAREVADDVALLAGGRIMERSAAANFFERPSTAAGRQFLRTGSCDLPSPGTPKTHLAPENRGEVKIRAMRSSYVPESRGPTGFCWLLGGRLGGTPQPGLFTELDTDLAALKRVGTTLVITLTEERTIAESDLARHGLRALWFPIPDMDGPDPAAAIRICLEAEKEMQAGGAAVYHCKAGLGRTGLMLVSHLILRGMAAPHALAFARRRKRQWVQSQKQEQYLWDFELFLTLKFDDYDSRRRENGFERDELS
ncbi:MAG: ATP-binding cassette domain-containing protein [Hyphomicrobiales bacterium]